MNFLFAILYQAGIQCYYFGIKVSSLWNRKAREWISGRKNFFEQIESLLQPDEYRVWFHCASVGEFEQGRPVMEAHRKKFPQHKIVLTFYSPSGFELRKNYPGADYIFYLPLDTKANASRFISLIDPKLAAFVKYELWFHFLSELNHRRIPSVMISAVFRDDHFLFKAFASPLKRVMMSFSKIFVQDESSLDLLKHHGFTNAQLAGDTRFDRVWEIAGAPLKISFIENFKNGKKLLVAGSTWQPDEKLILRLAAESDEDWKFVIVPHEIDAPHLQQLKDANLNFILASEAKSLGDISAFRVLIVDEMGLLSSIYEYATIAYIGGGFGKGIHNVLEAAVFGIPVLFGPNFEKFNEAKALIETGGGKSVKDFDELKDAVRHFHFPEYADRGTANRDWVKSKTGATEIIINFLEEIISNTAASPA